MSGKRFETMRFCNSDERDALLLKPVLHILRIRMLMMEKRD